MPRMRKRKREREEEAEKEIPVLTEWESNTFLAVPRRSSFSIRARSFSPPHLSPFPLHLLSYVLLRALLLHFVGPHEVLFGASSLVVLTLSVYTYYAKQVTVGGLGSQTRSE